MTIYEHLCDICEGLSCCEFTHAVARNHCKLHLHMMLLPHLWMVAAVLLLCGGGSGFALAG